MWAPKNIEIHAFALHTKCRTIYRSVVCQKFVMLNDGIFTFSPLHVSYFFYYVAFQDGLQFILSKSPCFGTNVGQHKIN